MTPATIANLVSRAGDRIGGGEFLDRSFEEGLAVLLDSISRCDRITPEGHERLTESIIVHLARRLEIDRYVGNHPELMDTPIERPVFVMGMPRTATTAVINLLAQDPARRTVLRWTLENPVPPPEADQLHSDPRCLIALDRQRRSIEDGLPGANIRFEWADSPAECVHVMNHDFKSMQWEASAPMPEYTDFIYSCDMTSAYTFHRRFLQVLQSRAPGTWALKGPSHTLWLPTLLAVYPDARLVWTHRDPCTAVASLCSLVANAHRRNCAEANHAYIGQRIPAGVAEHVRRPMAMLDKLSDRIHHIHFADFIGNEIGAMRDLYRWLGNELTPEVETGMERWLGERRQAQLGEHHYSLSDFGLSRKVVAPMFEDYTECFDINMDEARERRS
jgi:hypothetical protein